MNKIIISDTSCFIALNSLNHLQILHELFDYVLTTPEIQKEYGRKLPSWVIIKEVKDKNKIKALNESLDKGEASAIALALEIPESILIIDEKKGRKVAFKLKIKIIGTLKVILIAKQNGIIKSVKTLITRLFENNFRISKKLAEQILIEANEY